jgi:hypothetical protein
MAAEVPGRSVRWQVGSGLAAAVLLLTLCGSANASGRVTGTASVRVTLHLASAGITWSGRFRAVRPDGAVVAHGRVIDQPREQNGADWIIRRKLTTRAGTLQFRISGPFHVPKARLRWLIVGGTGIYAALHGHGVDIEHVQSTTATAVMRRVPIP